VTALPTRCPVCRAPAGAPFVEIERVPVFCNVQWPTREEAVAAARGDIRLVFCDACGMIWNTAFEPGLVEYEAAYENSLHYSDVFRRYARHLAARLVERYDVRDRDIVDIGSGNGDFLTLLCELGGNRGVGFDPSYRGPDLVAAGAGTVRFVRDLYSGAHAETPADLVCCRHVLEHLVDPAELLATLRRSLATRPDAVLYFEVPAAEYVLEHLSGWDVIYEHCSLFSAPALRGLFARAGFAIRDLGFSYGGQYLWVEAEPGEAQSAVGGAPEGVGDLARLAGDFERQFHRVLHDSRATLDELTARGPLAVWGAGSKGVTFLNLVASARNGDSVVVVDVNPRKQGKHVPGRGDRILAPHDLPEAAPATVLVTNPRYRREVERTLADLRLQAPVVVA
jgi:SAM-dependent methyltransferase